MLHYQNKKAIFKLYSDSWKHSHYIVTDEQGVRAAEAQLLRVCTDLSSRVPDPVLYPDNTKTTPIRMKAFNTHM